MDELEVTNCPHCGATIFGAGSLSASGKYCRHCISNAVSDIPLLYIKSNGRQSEVIAFAITGKPFTRYPDDAKNIFESLEENEPDLLDDFVREYVNEYQADYRAWLMEEF